VAIFGTTLRRWRWLILLVAWGTLLASLPMPAAHPQPGGSWFFPDPTPVFVMFLISPFMWPPNQLSVATICFAASPLLVWLWPRGRAGFAWRALAFGMLGIWVIPSSSLVLHGYYVWALSYTLAFVAALIPPIYPQFALDRTRGFSVIRQKVPVIPLPPAVRPPPPARGSPRRRRSSDNSGSGVAHE
jgi:hypothetical protein